MHSLTLLPSGERQCSRLLSLVLGGLHDLLGLWGSVARSFATPSWASWKAHAARPEPPCEKPECPTAETVCEDSENMWERREACMSPSFVQLPQRYQAHEHSPASPQLHSTHWPQWTLLNTKKHQAMPCLNSQPTKLWVRGKWLFLKPLHFG